MIMPPMHLRQPGCKIITKTTKCKTLTKLVIVHMYMENIHQGIILHKFAFANKGFQKEKKRQ